MQCYCSDGQSVAQRLSTQVKKATNAIRKGVALFNARVLEHNTSEAITFEQAADPSSDIYACIGSPEEVIFESAY